MSDTPKADNEIMSDTPEADAAVLASDWGWSLVLKETCRRLERERDKAEAGWSECREFAQRVVDERDEARAEAKTADEHRRLAEKLAETAMFERDQLRMRVAELQNGMVVEATK